MLTKIDERQLAGEPSRQWKIVLNDVFEKRARAAAVVGWWVVLIGVLSIIAQWLIFLAVLHTRPVWFLATWKPGVDWAFVHTV